MSVRARAGVAWGVLWTLVLLPARVIEEGIHALAAVPFAERVLVSLTPGDGGVETAVQYRESTPRWAIVAAHVAPEVVAAVAGLATIAWWIIGGAVWWPASTLDWILLWWLGVQYLAIAMPEQGSPWSGKTTDRAQGFVIRWQFALLLAVVAATGVIANNIFEATRILPTPSGAVPMARVSDAHTAADPNGTLFLLAVGTAFVAVSWIYTALRDTDRAQAAVDHWGAAGLGVALLVAGTIVTDWFAGTFSRPPDVLLAAMEWTRAGLSVAFVLLIIAGVWMWWGVRGR